MKTLYLTLGHLPLIVLNLYLHIIGCPHLQWISFVGIVQRLVSFYPIGIPHKCLFIRQVGIAADFYFVTRLQHTVTTTAELPTKGWQQRIDTHRVFLSFYQ